MKASATSWPPLVVKGLLIELLTTSTVIPGSMRIPPVSFICFTVTLNSGIAIGRVCLSAKIIFIFLICNPFVNFRQLKNCSYAHTDTTTFHFTGNNDCKTFTLLPSNKKSFLKSYFNLSTSSCASSNPAATALLYQEYAISRSSST